MRARIVCAGEQEVGSILSERGHCGRGERKESAVMEEILQQIQLMNSIEGR